MSDKLPPSIFPARFQILSGSMLKLLACIAMLIDPRILISASNERYIKTPGTIGMTEGIVST